jgi:hydroxymethylpyrimidine/phosphomethylpyrimidine kinase
MIPNVLSIAGSDPSGGAGIQADLKTFSALGCYGMAALTALTAQNTRGVTAVHVPPPTFLDAQLDALLTDIVIAAVKIGMLATGDMAMVVASRLAACRSVPVVLDPVLAATSGDSLGSPDVVEAMLRHLLPLVAVITPNLPEAARLADHPVAKNEDDMRATAAALHGRGARAVLIKGGHFESGDAVDLLSDPTGIEVFRAPRHPTRNTHGTGCTLSSAIAAYLARGLTLVDAVGAAKAYVTAAIAGSSALSVGGGHGPVHHFHAAWPPPEGEVR